MNIVILLTIIFLVAFIFLVVVFVIIPLFFGASFERTDERTKRILVKLAKIKKGDKVAELGSGDGSLVIEFAKKGANVVGFEINPFLVLYSKWKIKKEGLKNAKIFWKNFWKADLGNFDVISVFQVSYVMGKLEKKLIKEAKNKVRVVSNNWVFPNLELIKKEGNVFYYEIYKDRLRKFKY